MLDFIVFIFALFIVTMFTISEVKSSETREQFKQSVLNEIPENATTRIVARIDSLEKDFKEMSALVSYALESLDTRVKKNEEKFRKLSLKQKDMSVELKSVT